MDDLEFFDLLYQQWSKTTGAENTYWMPEPYEEGGFNIYSVDQEHNKLLIAVGLPEADADWITAVHGCFADLTRRLQRAVDESERLEIEKDNVICEMAQLAVENNDLRAENQRLNEELAYWSNR